MAIRLFAALFLSVFATLNGCAPPCEAVCVKTLECGTSPRLSQDECERECNSQTALYLTWEDTQKTEALNVHKACVIDSTCEQIEDKVCYQEELFVF